MDVTDEASMRPGSSRSSPQTGRIDVLVNNAGYGSYGAVEDVPLEEARRQFEVNLFGAARLIQLVLPHMRERSAAARSSTSPRWAARSTPRFGGWYHATKFALEALSDCLRLEIKPFGIDVVVIEPGGIATEWDGIAADKPARDLRRRFGRLRRRRSGPMARSHPRRPTRAALAADGGRRRHRQGRHRPPAEDPLRRRLRRQAADRRLRRAPRPRLRRPDHPCHRRAHRRRRHAVNGLPAAEPGNGGVLGLCVHRSAGLVGDRTRLASYSPNSVEYEFSEIHLQDPG